MVQVLKIGLPLLALTLLATLFLFSRQIDPGKAIPFAGVDVAEILSEQGIGGARFVGTTADGGTIRVDSERAAFAGDDLRATAISALIELADGAQVTFASDMAVVSGADQIVRFTGNVRVTANPGLVIESEELRATTDLSQIDSPGPVAAVGTMGRISAGSMSVSLDLAAGATGNLLVFQDGVRLVYLPGN